MFAPTALACRPVCTVEISADCVVNSLLFLLRARKLCCKCHAPCVAERYLRLEHNHETRIRDRVAAGNMLFQDCNRSRISDQFCNRGERRKAVGIDAFDFNGTAQCDITAGCTGKDLIFAGLCGPLLLLNIIAGKVLLTQFKCDSLLLAGLQEYLFQSLELLNGLVKRCLHIVDIDLNNLAAGHAAGIFDVDADVDGLAILQVCLLRNLQTGQRKTCIVRLSRLLRLRAQSLILRNILLIAMAIRSMAGTQMRR